MIRFISFLLGKPYETCKSCETLKEQLIFERDEKKRLTDTLLNIISPKAVEAAPIEINQIAQTSAMFSRRRAALEEKDRQEAAILKQKRFVGTPDNLKVVEPIKKDITAEELEKELGIEEKTN